jgi:hypothetical protein
VDLLEKWIWEKYRKHINYKQLIDVSEIDIERSSPQYSINKRGDLLIPLTYDASFWGQLVVVSGSDLSALVISQIVDLADLYFKLKVSTWTAGAESVVLEEMTETKMTGVTNRQPRIFFLKSASPEKSNYIISFLQERLGLQGKLPWEKNMDLEDESMVSLMIHINSIDAITNEDLLRLAVSERVPHIVITASGKMTDWQTWASLETHLKAKLAIIDADLDSMPMALSAAKDCIDLLWFAD